MIRAFMITLILFFSQAVCAQSTAKEEVEWVKDWRLEKPFFHGFIGAITFNQVKLFPKEWVLAESNEPNGLAPGSVEILEKNKKVPFTFGVITGATTISLILLALYRSFKYRYVIAHFKENMALHNE
jgi:hypothetical protein